jgi:hypothetical protein
MLAERVWSIAEERKGATHPGPGQGRLPVPVRGGQCRDGRSGGCRGVNGCLLLACAGCAERAELLLRAGAFCPASARERRCASAQRLAGFFAEGGAVSGAARFLRGSGAVPACFPREFSARAAARNRAR